MSYDAGEHWSVPEPVYHDVPWYTSGGQTSFAIRGRHLYFTLSERYGSLAAVSIHLDKGLLTPDAWRVSPLVEMPVPDELLYGTFTDGTQMRRLEGNAVLIQDQLIVVARAIFNCLLKSHAYTI